MTHAVSDRLQWRIQQFWKKGEDNLSAPSSFIGNAQNEMYTFYTEKAAFRKKNMSQLGAAAPTLPFESATGRLNCGEKFRA